MKTIWDAIAALPIGHWLEFAVELDDDGKPMLTAVLMRDEEFDDPRPLWGVSAGTPRSLRRLTLQALRRVDR